jgi:hypothetical protein
LICATFSTLAQQSRPLFQPILLKISGIDFNGENQVSLFILFLKLKAMKSFAFRRFQGL